MRHWQTKRSANVTFGPIFVPVVGLHLLRVRRVDLRRMGPKQVLRVQRLDLRSYWPEESPSSRRVP